MPLSLDPVYCRYRRQPIDSAASVCPFCGRDQSGVEPVTPQPVLTDPETEPPRLAVPQPVPSPGPLTRNGILGCSSCFISLFSGLALGMLALVLLMTVLLISVLKGCASSVH